jgi:hypothetical protein
MARRDSACWTFGSAFVALVVIHLIMARDLVFGAPIFEINDAAANALQIDKAKHVAELLGNYSRFGFHHPGPAFFYVYALGEALFFDVLHMVAAPANAHLLASILLQSVFLAAAIAVAARLWAPGRPAFVAAAVAIAIVELTIAGAPQLSIWPPYVLAAPFACFLVAAVAVAGGWTAILPLMVLAGGFLVHGHVAQPLFVGTIGIAAVLLGRRFVARDFAIAAAIAVPFVATIVLAELLERPSNLGLILASAHSAGRSPLDALVYVLGMLSMPTDTTTIVTSFAPLGVIAWAVLVGVPAWLLRGRLGQLYPVLMLASGLAFVWALLQQGDAFAFNSFFVFGLLLVALLPIAVLASRFDWRVVGAVAAVAVIVVLLTAVPPTLRREPEGARLAATAATIRGPVLLEFDGSQWAEATGLAIALERDGQAFYVDRRWGFLFGYDRVDPPAGVRMLVLTPAMYD